MEARLNQLLETIVDDLGKHFDEKTILFKDLPESEQEEIIKNSRPEDVNFIKEFYSRARVEKANHRLLY